MTIIKRVEEYETTHEVIGCVRLATNKKWEGGNLSVSTRRVEPVPNSRKVDYIRDLVLLGAKRASLMELPYTISGIWDSVYADDDSVFWYDALRTVRLRGDQKRLAEFTAALNDIDFRVYDEGEAAALSKAYSGLASAVNVKETKRENQNVVDVEEAEFMEEGV